MKANLLRSKLGTGFWCSCNDPQKSPEDEAQYIVSWDNTFTVSVENCEKIGDKCILRYKDGPTIYKITPNMLSALMLVCPKGPEELRRLLKEWERKNS